MSFYVITLTSIVPTPTSEWPNLMVILVNRYSKTIDLSVTYSSSPNWPRVQWPNNFSITWIISSRIDYCNSLLYGLPEYQLNKLQRVQNMCARLICNESKYCHITPLLVDLHWLPVKFRIEFKILLIVFKIFQGLAPSYLGFLITPKPVSKYNLRSFSDSTLLLSYPNVKLNTTLGELPRYIRESISIESDTFRESWRLTFLKK